MPLPKEICAHHMIVDWMTHTHRGVPDGTDPILGPNEINWTYYEEGRFVSEIAGGAIHTHEPTNLFYNEIPVVRLAPAWVSRDGGEVSGVGLTLSSPQVYARILQRLAMAYDHSAPPPSLEKFLSMEPEKQESTLVVFSYFNPGVWVEVLAGRKVVDIREVVDGQLPHGNGKLTHTEYVLGEPLGFVDVES